MEKDRHDEPKEVPTESKQTLDSLGEIYAKLVKQHRNGPFDREYIDHENEG